MIVGFGLFLVSSWPLFNALPIVSARIIMAGNLAVGRSPLSLNISRASSRGTLIMRLEFLGFLGVKCCQPLFSWFSLFVLKDYESEIMSHTNRILKCYELLVAAAQRISLSGSVFLFRSPKSLTLNFLSP